jgi:hypothetical protein
VDVPVGITGDHVILMLVLLEQEEEEGEEEERRREKKEDLVDWGAKADTKKDGGYPPAAV